MTANKEKNINVQNRSQRGRRIHSFIRWMRERFFLRLHMSLILMGTVLSGLLATKVLLLLDVDNIVVRYPLSVLCAYLAFFLFVKLWLNYITAAGNIQGPDPSADIIPDLPNFGDGTGPDIDLPRFSGGGGDSGGGGVSASFDGPATQAAFSPPSSGASVSGIGDAVGDTASGIVDSDEGAIVLIVLGVLLAAIFGAGIYLIYIAPHILSEAAFDFVLGSSLIRSYRKVTGQEWMGSVLKDTYKPFLFALVVSFAAAWLIRSYMPEFTSVSDIFRQ